jgi:hypothetical protein
MIAHHDNSKNHPYAAEQLDWVRFGLASFEEMSFAIFMYYSDEGVIPKPPSMMSLLTEYVAEHGSPDLYQGIARTGKLPLPTLLELPSKGMAYLRYPLGVQMHRLRTGEIQWDNDAFVCEHDGGFGRIVVKGRRNGDGSVDAEITIANLPTTTKGQLGTGTWPFQGKPTTRPGT